VQKQRASFNFFLVHELVMKEPREALTKKGEGGKNNQAKLRSRNPLPSSKKVLVTHYAKDNNRL